jgi:hypothetical protein
MAGARGLDATLEPGEVLWLPSFYWHYVRQLDEGQPNLSVNCWCGAKTDGSTILGGRAHKYPRANHTSTAPTPVGVPALLGSSYPHPEPPTLT